MVIFCSVLVACSPSKKEQIPSTSFQCIPSQSVCEVVNEFGTVLVKFNVEKVLVELPFQLRVELIKDTSSKEENNHKKLINVSGYMEGKTMFMGKIPLFFNKENSGTENMFVAETMLGSCSEDIMTWRLWLTLEEQDAGGNKKQTIFFIDFDSSRF